MKTTKLYPIRYNFKKPSLLLDLTVYNLLHLWVQTAFSIYVMKIRDEYNLTQVELSEKSIVDCGLGHIVSIKNKIHNCNIYNVDDLLLYPIL